MTSLDKFLGDVKERVEMKQETKESLWRNNIQELLDVISKATKEDDFTWSWSRSDGLKCKYINIRIDMRDGGFIITNDEGECISVEELWRQGLEK